jgi:hypothetical protein
MRKGQENLVVEEFKKTYAGHERIVLVTEASYEFEEEIISIKFYFDKETGILLEFEKEDEGYLFSKHKCLG